MCGGLPNSSVDRRLFTFVTTRLRWCAGIPMAPQLFDAVLAVWVSVTDRSRMRAMEQLERRLCAMPGVSIGIHALGGVGFRFKDVEFAHLHATGLFDVLLRPGDAETVRRRGEARPHHRFPESSWVSYWINDDRDIPGACHLASLATDCLAAGIALPKSATD